MGRYSLRLRSIYDENEPTVGEGIQRGVQKGLDMYAQRRETARQEGNTVGAAGGTRLPDQARPGIADRLRGAWQGAQNAIHGRLPGLPGAPGGLQPTGDFVQAQPREPGRYPMDERLPGGGVQNPDAMVSEAIMGGPGGAARPADLRRVVRPAPPVGALPPSPRGSYSMPGAAAVPGVMPYDTTPGGPDERTFEYQGTDGARYQMPQTGERERANAMLDYSQKLGINEAERSRHEGEQVDLYTDARAHPGDARAEGRYRAATGTWKYDEDFGQQSRTGGKLTAAEQAELIHIRGREARLTKAVSSGTSTPEDRAELRDIQRRRLELDERKASSSADQKAASADATAAEGLRKGVVTDPMKKMILASDSAATAANDRRGQLSDSLSRAATAGSHAAALRVRAPVRAKAPAGTPTKQAGIAEQNRLMRDGNMTLQQARDAMRGAGWRIK